MSLREGLQPDVAISPSHEIASSPYGLLAMTYNHMTFPSLLFALLVASFYGLLYHLIRNGGFWRLVLYLVLSTAGFAIGHFVGLWRGWIFFPLGSLNIGMSSVGSLLILIFGDWLSRIETGSENKV